MLDRSDLVTFTATTDPQRARSFYEGVLGLKLIEETPFALAFDANGTVLRIQVVQQFTPQPHTALGWSVAAIEATVRALAAHDVAFERFPGLEQDQFGIWASPSGVRIAWFKDPDGNLLSLSQMPE